MNSSMRATKIPGWYEFTRIACPICNKTGGCMQYKEGDRVACIRTVSDRPFSKNSSLPSYLHFLIGKDKRKKIQSNDHYKNQKKKKDATLNIAYQLLLSVLDLNDEHYNHLTSKDRGLSNDQIMIREYRSFPELPWKIINKLKEEYNLVNYAGVPGFYQATGKYGKYWTLNGNNGILIPYRNYKNQIVGFQYRIDEPLNNVKIHDSKNGLHATVLKQPNIVQVRYNNEILFEKKLELDHIVNVYKGEQTKNNLIGKVSLKKGNRYYWLSSANKDKGTSSGDPAPVHVSVPTFKLEKWNTGEPLKTKTVWLSEGALKTDISSDYIHKVFTQKELEKYGDTFLALPGVNAWALALPILEKMGVETVNICFDADIVDNEHVKKTLMDCIKALKNEGYHVNMVIWNPNDGKGIDDLLLNNKAPQFIPLF